MSLQRSRCKHVTFIGDCRKEDIIKKQQVSKCDSCDNKGPNLWVCLRQDCLHTGCGEAPFNHWVQHFEEENQHCLYLNLTALRVFCLKCKNEVFLENNDPPLPGMITRPQTTKRMHNRDSESEDEVEVEDESLKPRGLTGLQNLGNTCYMNSALQALSNCPQLTYFFLECGAFVRSEKKPGLAKSYMRLVREMWHKRRPSYVVPSGIAYGIKMVFPVFRGFMQQDAQEFLRCFMDQLHEELKEVCVEVPGATTNTTSPEDHDEFDNCHGESGMGASEESSQSDGDFETCDSGLSSEKSSCADERGDEAELCMTETNESLNSPFPYGNHYPQHQVYPQVRPQLVEEDKTTKGCPNFFQQQQQAPANDTVGLLAQSDTSDSGVPYSRTVDFSECDSFGDRKSLAGLYKLERFTDCNKCKQQNSYSLRQCASTQKQNLSPHSIISSNFSSRRRKPVHYRSIVSDTFDGKILSSVQCLTCDTISTTRETFQDLSLPIPSRDHLHMLHASQGNQQKSATGGSSTCTDAYSHQGWFSWLFGWMLSWFWGPAVSLQDCLSAFFSADELKGDNMYSCEKCKKLRNGIKYSKVLELPEVLCIHLKRFRHEVMFSAKISNYVSFPLEGLDMSGFLHKSAYPRGVTTYDLAAVICHHGTAGSGHYTAYALNCLNDQWYEFDDQYVTAVDPQVVQNCEAYVLFYRKSTDEIIKKRQRAVELMERSKNEHGLLQFHISKQWVNKFNTFAEPGPITNTDFLCSHGGVPPSRVSYVEDLCTVLPQAVWEYLHDTFGGGPSCTHLYICPICQAEQESLNLRRKTEHDKFVTLNSEFLSKDNPPMVYAISVSWFKIWESFVRGKDSDLPGPIDNSSIGYVKGNQAVLKLGSDYGSLSEDMWRYLHGIYGGGPEIVLQQNVNTMCCNNSSATISRPSSTGSSNSSTQVIHGSTKGNFVCHSNSSTSSRDQHKMQIAEEEEESCKDNAMEEGN